MYKETIGILGGFGAYATLNFYKMILEEFASESERNYPHIFFDNDFTMPSRTRALLYNEEYEIIVRMIADSMRKMMEVGADHIILVCGTAHAFLPDVYKVLPEVQNRVINIIDLVSRYLRDNAIDKVLIIAAEGTLKKRIYENMIGNVQCISPGFDYYDTIRMFIEAVKTNSITDEIIDKWSDFLSGFNCNYVVLGCTEFPVLADEYLKHTDYGVVNEYTFIDPLKLAIEELRRVLR